MVEIANPAKIRFDVVMPKGNEEAFIEQAKALGYSEIVFLYVSEKDIRRDIKSDMPIRKALLVRSTADITRSKGRFEYVFAPAERMFFESDPDYIIDAETGGKDSLHYRTTKLNQVHAELAKKNGITIVFSFSNLLSSPSIMKGKMKQNASLVRKYKLDHVIFSLAKDPSMMRSRAVLDALGATLGL